MASSTLIERAPTTEGGGERSRLDRLLAHPLAFLLTAAILLVLFGGSFVANPDRVAPTKDPAYYSWRTEALISEDPQTMLEIEGAFDMYAGGYRVSAAVLGGFLRQVGGLSLLRTTVLLMIVLPVITALLLAGFVYRSRPDPIAFHAVALGSGSLFLTPPFVGYLDNVLALMFLAAALFFIAPAGASWPARLGLGLFLFVTGLTHLTTLAIFGLVLGTMAVARFVFRGFDRRATVRDDGPMLLTALTAALAVAAVWLAGIWGEPASLTEAALPPPYESDFFVARMLSWVDAMNPWLNGPLFALGLAGLLTAGRRWVDDEVARPSIVWLAPLAGLFGFVAGLTYPYYRFFNTTLSWVLLVGFGGAVAIRFFIDRALRGGAAMIAIVGVAAVVAVFAANYATGYEVSNWNNQESDWLSLRERDDLLALQAAIRANTDRDRPVVFVIDDRPSRPFRIWGFTKLSGNQSRFSLPPGQIDQGYLYLGSLDNFLQGEPTLIGEQTYDRLSRALLDNAREGIEEAGQEPLVVVAKMFNAGGANVGLFQRASDIATAPDADIWLVWDKQVRTSSGDEIQSSAQHPLLTRRPGYVDLLLTLGGLALLLLPGALAARWFLGPHGLAQALGMVPALTMALLTVIGVVVLAVLSSPLSITVAWLALAIALLVGIASFVRARSLRGGPPITTT